MSSFSCPHFDPDSGQCWRLRTECVPGRTGCVLGGGKANFAYSLEERMAGRGGKAAPSQKAVPPENPAGDQD